MKSRIAAALVLACGLLFAEPAAAIDPNHRTIEVRMTIGDGKDGRIYAKWQEQLGNRPVETIAIRLQKRSGRNNAYVNLRFGNGQSFDNNREVQLTDGAAQTVTWSPGGASANGLPLILSAYNCEVDVTGVEVTFSPSVGPPDLTAPHADEKIRPSSGDWVRGGGGWDGDSADGSADGGDGEVKWDEKPGHPAGGYGGRGDKGAGARCKEMKVQAARIEIGRVMPTGGLFSGKYNVSGSVAGVCIEEAGYYEKGRLKTRIEIPLSDQFKREEFDVRAESGERGEIRVYTSDGKEQFLAIDEAVRKLSPY